MSSRRELGSAPVGSRAAILAAICLLLGACALYPPRDGVSVGDEDGLGAVIRRYGIQPLDPARPLLRQAADRAARSDPDRSLRGVTYNLTEGNRLPRDWIVQSPSVWGLAATAVSYIPVDCTDCDPDFRLPSCRTAADCRQGSCGVLHAAAATSGAAPARFCLGHSDSLIDRFYDLVVTAERAVDITMLQPPAELRFRAGLRNAITRLARSGKPVTIRILIGSHPPKGTDLKEFAGDLLRDAAQIASSKLRVYVGTTRSCDGDTGCGAFSWNHAKIVTVDGRAALVGGHNMWTEDYLLDDPVHDLSMQVEGPAAYDAHRFADALWAFVCGRPRDDPLNRAYALLPGAGEIARGCLAAQEIRPPRPATGGIAVLAIGRLAKGITNEFADQSLLVEGLMLGAARKTIRMVQQDIAFSLAGGVDQQWPKAAIDHIADVVGVHGGDAYLVLSSPGADGHMSDYSNHIALDAVVRRVRDNVGRRMGLAEPALSQLICEHLHVAPLRFGPDDTWPDGKPIGVHAKFWMIDDRAFHIGSENLYPVELQEFGYILENPAAAATIKRDYWDKAWEWSRRAAVSGGGAPRCVLMDSARR